MSGRAPDAIPGGLHVAVLGVGGPYREPRCQPFAQPGMCEVKIAARVQLAHEALIRLVVALWVAN